MNIVEEWLKEQGKLTEYSRGVLLDLVEEAEFALYCQRGSGSCMGNFGVKIARYAHIFGVDSSELFNKILTQAAKESRDNKMDI